MVNLNSEQKRLQRSIAGIQKEYSAEIKEADLSEEIPGTLLKALKDSHILSFMVPRELGGQGGDIQTYCLILEELAKLSGSLSLFAHSQMSSSVLLQLGEDGTQTRSYLLRQVSDERFVAAIGMTESGAGSDLSAMDTRAILDGDHNVLNGHKCFVSNGSLADIFFVFAKPTLFQDIKDLLILIVEKEMEGVKVERNETKLGMKGTPLSAVSFEEVRLTRDRLLAGGGNDGGRQFKKIMGGLNISRLGAAAIALGLAQAAIDGAIGFIRGRGGMNDPTEPGQAVQFILADGEAKVEAIRALIYRTAERIDREEGNLIKAASVAKYFATETAMQVALNTFHTFRSHGMTGDYPMERILRDLTCTLILEGTSQIHQVIIARELMKSSHADKGP